MTTTVVLSGGPFDAALVRAALRAERDIGLVVAADSGLHVAESAGLLADAVIGDMDSVDADALARALRAGAEEFRHPTDKDATDIELALDHVLERLAPIGAPRSGRPRVLVVGSDSGRLDHLLGWVAVFGASRYAALDLEAVLGRTRVIPVHDSRSFDGVESQTVTLLALHGQVEGVTTTGLRWPLEDEPFGAGSSRGVSNEMTGARASVAIRGGVLTVVIPPLD